MALAIVNPNHANNPLTVIIAVRKLLLKDKAGNLSENQLLTMHQELVINNYAKHAICIKTKKTYHFNLRLNSN